MLVAVAEQTQQEEEEVDEVEVERKGSPHGEFGAIFGADLHTTSDPFQFLYIIGGQSGEYQYTEYADDVIHRAAVQEPVHHHGDDQTDQCHEEQRTELGKVLFGGPTGNGHYREHACGNEERGVDGTGRIGQENEAQTYTNNDRIRDEHQQHHWR